MIKAFARKVFGDRHAREARKLQPLVDEINEIQEGLAGISRDELRGKTDEFRARIHERVGPVLDQVQDLRERKSRSQDPSERESLGLQIAELDKDYLAELEEALDDILPEAFAVVKEACRRLVGSTVRVTGHDLVWDMIPYDVQLIGAIALHQGKAAEMATGEGKTLVATMPLYLNSLAGRGAHLVTVNSYLARRDAQWMGYIYESLGLTTDVIDEHQPGSEERRQAYLADITYGTNNEFGFDYLRDNMVHDLAQRVQRGHPFAIIDEVDSILIDEARTPLIISGPVGRDTSTPFKQMAPLVGRLYRQQSKITGELVAAAHRELEAGNEHGAGESLLAVKRGTPKNKRLLKLFAEDPGIQKLVQKVEGDYMREKRLHEIDELLLFAMDEKGHNVHLSDKGLDTLSPGEPDAFVVPDLSEAMGELEQDETLSVDDRRERIQALEGEYATKSQKIHVIHQLLKAYALYHRNEQYILGENGAVVIVDEFTGRQMPGRRWSDGLHQAVEAKEGVEVRGETQTLATITIQNYFRMYDKLAGMTGTAETEENEFHQIYGLDVMVIPTNRPVIRDDRDDLIFRTVREKYNALMDEIGHFNRLELPVLVGTTNVDVSETLSRMLKRRGIRHNVLNAKQHLREAEIVAEAGPPGAATIPTNLAARATAIKLGEGVRAARTVGWARARGLDLDELYPVDPRRVTMDLEKKPDDFVVEVGGLHILGSARHDSRRIDRQLRGRAGRQGDPGTSQFFLSLEDDLMRLFMSDRVAGAMEKLGAEEGEVIAHPLVTRSIGRAQVRVEGNNFEARKRLLDYDDVMNQQREVIYDLRLFALEGGEDLKGEIWEMIEYALGSTLDEYVPASSPEEEWDLAGLKRRLLLEFLVLVNDLPDGEESVPELDHEDLAALVNEAGRDAFQRKLEGFGETAERVTSYILLSVIDQKWKDHLYDLDHLKASISYRSWGQKDPLVEYKKEAYDMFVDLMHDLRKTLASLILRAQVEQQPMMRRRPMGGQRLTYTGPQETSAATTRARPAAPVSRRAGVPGGVDATGIARSARAAVGSATDVSTLATNRGEARKSRPVTVEARPGRNDPCPCGSGKKYKKCCRGRAA
ncbi:MAG: preprotein translocase subunit SecA [Gammaproteobacteria bacterium]|nr:preprotein translocase subunit SecA [Gammaproteobacteria bacterium]